MVMALRARHRQAQEASRGRINTVVLHFRAQCVESQTSQIFIFFRQLIARDLRLHERVVRHVGIEGSNYPVAIPERIGVGLVLGRVQLVVGIPRDVQPVPPPAFAITGRREQSVDHSGKRIRRLIPHKPIHLIRRRRQAREIEIRAPDQSPPLGLTHRRQALFLQLRQNKPVQVIVRPLRVPNPGRRRFHHGLE